MSRADLEAGNVIRMSLLFRVQHLLLTVLLTVLAVTGFALMYHENSLAQWIIRLEGGVHNRGIVHRIAAVLLMANLVYHVFYMLLSREGKPELRQLFIVRQDIDDFFQSQTWEVIRNLGVFFVVVLWLATAYWVFKDARRRVEDPWLVAMATLLGLVPPFLGPIIYLFFRPPEYLDDVRERELEIKAMEERLTKRDLHCPVCRAQVDASFLVCPVCTTRLKQACVSCGNPLEALWQICPYCATPVATPSLPGIDDTIAESWTSPPTQRASPPRKRAAESE